MCEIFGGIIRSPDPARLVRELMLDPVGLKQAGFIEYRARETAEPVNRSLPAQSDPVHDVEHPVLADDPTFRVGRAARGPPETMRDVISLEMADFRGFVGTL